MEKQSKNPVTGDISDVLEWYTDIGMTVAIGNEPVNHKQVRPSIHAAKNPMLPATAGTDPLPKMGVPSKQAMNSRAIAAACKTVDELRQAIVNFEGCDLKMTATHTVFSDGNPDAKIMIIGEAPGADEDRQGRPFVGLSGQLLDKVLASINLSRAQNIYISNIISWRPPGNRTPTPHEIALCQPFIERHIELIAPKILILVGGVSAKTLLNTNEGIMKLRGKWHEFKTPTMQDPIKTMATYHPAFLLRSPGQKAAVWKDLLLVQEEMQKSGLA
jgi:DNA polymerase